MKRDEIITRAKGIVKHLESFANHDAFTVENDRVFDFYASIAGWIDDEYFDVYIKKTKDKNYLPIEIGKNTDCVEKVIKEITPMLDKSDIVDYIEVIKIEKRVEI